MALREWMRLYDAGNGALPPGSPEAAVLFYMAAEHGIWAHELPLLSLPPALGADVLELFILNVPHRLDALQHVKRAVQILAAREH